MLFKNIVLWVYIIKVFLFVLNRFSNNKKKY